MRVLITTDAVGGVWTFTRELAEGLLEADCHVLLACVGPAPSPAQAEWARNTASSPRFHFEAVDAPLEWMQTNERALDASARLLDFARQFQPDLIHSNQFCFGALDTGVPVVITAHSDVLSWASSCRAEPLPDTPWLRRYVTLVTEGLQQATAVAAPTHAMLDALAANFNLPANRKIIANGRSLTAVPSPRRMLQAVSCGRLWDEAKNVSLLASVDSPMPLFVAGELACEDSSSPTHLGAARLLGPLAEPDLLDRFRASSIYICTSVYEPFGLAPLEAALCGCALLANDIPSLREVWGDAALYFRTAAELTRLLQQLSDDLPFLAERQRQSAARAARYTRESMTGAYLDLYAECLHPAEVSRAA